MPLLQEKNGALRGSFLYDCDQSEAVSLALLFHAFSRKLTLSLLASFGYISKN